MRRLPQRPSLPAGVEQRLGKETEAIKTAADPKSEASSRYEKARKAKWFVPVLERLREMAGPGKRCMFCSGSEASDVEHYRPKAVFPEMAMQWTNYLWGCTPCNRCKGNRFPPDTAPGGRIVNPAEENPWDFFYIGEFGLLTPLYDKRAKGLNPRAKSTCEILRLNREALQESRKRRMDALKKRVSDSLALWQSGDKTKEELREDVERWIQEPFQSDVADYFLRGPGKREVPFGKLFEALGEMN